MDFFFYHIGLLMHQDICSVMCCSSPCFLFRLESSGYTIFCSHTQLQGLGICTFSWHMHWTGSPPLEQSVLLWLLFSSFLSRLWNQDVWLFLIFEEGTLFACVLHPSELPSHWLFVGCCGTLFLWEWYGWVSVGCTICSAECNCGDIVHVLCAIFPFIGLVYEGHQSRFYSFYGFGNDASCIARFAGSICSHSGFIYFLYFPQDTCAFITCIIKELEHKKTVSEIKWITEKGSLQSYKIIFTFLYFSYMYERICLSLNSVILLVFLYS